MELKTTDYSGVHGGPEVVLRVPVALPDFVETATLTVTYWPHKAVVGREDFTAWVTGVQGVTWTTWEALATTVIDTFYDVVLPYRVEVALALHAREFESEVRLARARPA